MSAPGIDIREAARLGKLLHKRWPGCTIGRANNGPHEVRQADGTLIASDPDFGACLRTAAEMAVEKITLSVTPHQLRRLWLVLSERTQSDEYDDEEDDAATDVIVLNDLQKVMAAHGVTP